MPFIAECLFCHAKMRVPDESEGMSVACPRCGDSFTLVPMVNPPEVKAANLRPPPTASATAAAVLAAARVEDEKPEPGAAPTARPAPQDEPWRRPLIFPYELIGGVALVLAGCAAACVPIPAFQTAAISLAGSAVVLGVVGWVVARKPDRGGRTRPAAGAALGAAVLLLVTFWPDLFAGGPPFGDNTPRPLGADAVTPGGEQPAEPPTGASTPEFRLGALRIQVVKAEVAPVKFAGGPTTVTPERALQITVRVLNGGRGRPIHYSGWSRMLPGEKTPPASLRDGRGKAYALRNYGAGRDVAGQLREARIPSNDRVEDVLVFEPPAVAVDSLRLELALTAVESTGRARLEIPGSLVTVR